MRLLSGLTSLINRFYPDSYAIDVKYLSIYRVIFCLAFMLFVGLPSYTWIGGISKYFYRPPGFSLAFFYDSFPSLSFLNGLTAVNIILFVMMFFGLWCKWSSVLFSLTSIIGHTYWYSFGHVDHYLLWMITPALLGLSGWGAPRQLEQNNTDRDNSFYIQLLALAIGFSMFTSGMQKIGGGWLYWSKEGTHYNLVNKAFEFDTKGVMVDYALLIKGSLIWKLMDYGTVIMEIGFLISVWRRKVFNYFLAVALIFHILVLLLFNIRFFSNIIVYLVFIDWRSVDEHIGFSRLLAAPALYRRLKIALSLFASALFLYWGYCVFALPGRINNSGLFEILFTRWTSIHNPYEASLNLLFAVAGVIMVYLSYIHVKKLLRRR